MIIWCLAHDDIFLGQGLEWSELQRETRADKLLSSRSFRWKGKGIWWLQGIQWCTNDYKLSILHISLGFLLPKHSLFVYFKLLEILIYFIFINYWIGSNYFYGLFILTKFLMALELYFYHYNHKHVDDDCI